MARKDGCAGRSEFYLSIFAPVPIPQKGGGNQERFKSKREAVNWENYVLNKEILFNPSRKENKR
jgi:hypothetical protein